MIQHTICLSIDTDPDGLNTHTPDRRSLVWDGLHYAMTHFHDALPQIPLTWYVRADGQLEHVYGSLRYLFDAHAGFWQQAIERGHELGWHPHLYHKLEDGNSQLIRDSEQALDELERIWQAVAAVPFELASFRMGEGWHTTQTLNLVESLGFAVDSSAIPGRDDSPSGHPRNWRNAPNHPYFPADDDIRLAGAQRPLLEVPMNSWAFQASYDNVPKLRYMNPCIHADLWQQAVAYWQQQVQQSTATQHVWCLILHPAEAMPHDDNDRLYAYSLDVMRANLHYFTARIEHMEHAYQYSTVSAAARRWREQI